MSNPSASVIREVRINAEYGLHMRPAELLSKAAMKFASDISVLHVSKGEFADAKSLLDLMMLAAECGSILRIQAQGPDAEAAVAALCRFVESNFLDDSMVPPSQTS